MTAVVDNLPGVPVRPQETAAEYRCSFSAVERLV